MEIMIAIIIGVIAFAIYLNFKRRESKLSQTSSQSGKAPPKPLTIGTMSDGSRLFDPGNAPVIIDMDMPALVKLTPDYCVLANPGSIVLVNYGKTYLFEYGEALNNFLTVRSVTGDVEILVIIRKVINGTFNVWSLCCRFISGPKKGATSYRLGPGQYNTLSMPDSRTDKFSYMEAETIEAELNGVLASFKSWSPEVFKDPVFSRYKASTLAQSVSRDTGTNVTSDKGGTDDELSSQSAPAPVAQPASTQTPIVAQRDLADKLFGYTVAGMEVHANGHVSIPVMDKLSFNTKDGFVTQVGDFKVSKRGTSVEVFGKDVFLNEETKTKATPFGIVDDDETEMTILGMKKDKESTIGLFGTKKSKNKSWSPFGNSDDDDDQKGPFG